jgi:hypothetical protein
MQAHVPKANLTGGGFIQSPDASRFLTSILAVVQDHLTQARDKSGQSSGDGFSFPVSALELKFSRIVLLSRELGIKVKQSKAATTAEIPQPADNGGGPGPMRPPPLLELS